MSRTMKLFASLLVALTASAATADAAFVSAHASASARVAKPVAAPARGVVHGGATVVRGTPHRPASGPAVVHASGTAWRR